MADPVFQEAGTYTSLGGTSSSTVTSVIANVAANDFVVFMVQRDEIAQITSVAGNGAGLSSFTLLHEMILDGAGLFGVRLYGAKATSSAASVTITATFSAAGPWGEGSSARYSNGDSIVSLTPLATGVAQGWTGAAAPHATSTDREVDAVTIAAGKRAFILACGTEYNLSGTVLTAQNSWAKRYASNNEQWLFDRTVDAGTFGGAGTSNRIATAGASDNYFAVVVALEISGGGSTVSGAGTSVGGGAAHAGGAATSARAAVATALASAAGAGASTFARAGASLGRADVVGSVLGVTAKSAISVGSGVAAAVRASIAAGNGTSLGAGLAAATFTATASRSGVALGSAPSIGSIYARLLLQWDDAGADEGYRIQWGYASGVYTSSADVATDVLQYLLAELPLDTNVYWRVAALVGGTPQDWSAEKVARTTYYFCTARGSSTAYATGAAIVARAGVSASSGFAVGNYSAINIVAAAGAASGSAAAAAVRASTFSAVGASLGAGVAAASGASTAAVSGVSIGSGFVAGSYAVSNVQSAYGSALGGGYVAGEGRSTAAAVGASLGQSANTGAGGATVARAGSAVAWAFAAGDYSASNIQARAAMALACGFARASGISTAEASGAVCGSAAARAAGASTAAQAAVALGAAVPSAGGASTHAWPGSAYGRGWAVARYGDGRRPPLSRLRGETVVFVLPSTDAPTFIMPDDA